MDQQTDEQKPSSKEGGEVSYTKGDVVWVRATVAHNSPSSLYMELDCNCQEVIAIKSDCRPEAEMLDGNELVSKHNQGIEVQGE
jgi:hypothetical protein